MIHNLFRRRSTWITITAVIVAIFLLWQTAIIEIILFAQFNGSQEGNAIALSFDDGPDWGEEALISALNEAGIRATFFWTWGKIEQIRSIDDKGFEGILRLIEEGEHEIGIHGYYCRVSWNPIDRFLILNEQEDITILQENYYELFGKAPQLYRSHGPRSGRQFYNSLANSGLILAFGSLAYQISNQQSVDTFIDKISLLSTLHPYHHPGQQLYHHLVLMRQVPKQQPEYCILWLLWSNEKACRLIPI